jgi:2-oxoglutarate dehydrogenase complex dehydrogenase (E1) component-like enzyme
VLRMEQLYPWPGERLEELIGRFPNLEELVWLQEEPRNMGSWRFAKRYLFEAYGDRCHIRAVTRPESASPAAGSATVHKQEQEQLLEDTFADL